MEFDAQASIDHLRSMVKQQRLTGDMMLKVLVVEDDDNDAILLLHVLEQFPVLAVWTRRGQEALQAISSDGFKVIFLDLRLPDLDGLDVIRKLRELKSETCVVVVTGWATEAVMDALRVLGQVILIRKPATVENIGSVLGMVARKQMPL